jgi:hypothetical protein
VYGNPIDSAIKDLFEALASHCALDPDQEPLFHELMVPFKLLAMRSAQVLPRKASGSSLRRLPKELCCMVGEMFV